MFGDIVDGRLIVLKRNMDVSTFKLSVIVLGAMVINLAMGCITGTLIPLILLKLKQDPAQVSSIFLTFVTDTGGFFIFLTLGSLVLL